MTNSPDPTKDPIILCDMTCVGATTIGLAVASKQVPVLKTTIPLAANLEKLKQENPDVAFGPGTRILAFICNPLTYNTRLYARRSFQASSRRDVPLEQPIDQEVPPLILHGRIHAEFVNGLGADLTALTQHLPGLASVPTEQGTLYLVATDVPVGPLQEALSEQLGVRVALSGKMGHDQQDTSKVFADTIKAELPTDYIRKTLRSPIVARVYGKAKMLEMRLERENSVESRRLRREVTFEEFGNEVTFENPPPDFPGIRTFEAEGAFMHHPGRYNIAISRYWARSSSHPEDFLRSRNWHAVKERNYALWKRGDAHGVSSSRFEPNRAVAVHEVAVQVQDLPIDNYPFLLGDGCLYYDAGGGPQKREKRIPGPSEAHCASISLRESSRFFRTVAFPSDLPLYCSEEELISIPQHFARHHPHVLEVEDLEVARVRVRVSYRPIEEVETVHKFVRIPYLDQYPQAPTLIQPNRPWYKAWENNEPLVVRGFSVYFSPRPPTEQHLRDLKLYVIDADGNPVPGKQLTMRDQNTGGPTESMSLDPGFVRGTLVVEPGEALSASGSLVEGTPAADMGFYVLVEIPKSLQDEAYGSPLYFSQGSANLDYLRNQYPQDRIDFNSTPAAYAILETVTITPEAPWADILGRDAVPRTRTKSARCTIWHRNGSLRTERQRPPLCRGRPANLLLSALRRV